MALGSRPIDDDVANLARTTPVALEQFAIKDEARADAAADLDRQRGSDGRPCRRKRYAAMVAAQASLATVVGSSYRALGDLAKP